MFVHEIVKEFCVQSDFICVCTSIRCGFASHIEMCTLLIAYLISTFCNKDVFRKILRHCVHDSVYLHFSVGVNWDSCIVKKYIIKIYVYVRAHFA